MVCSIISHPYITSCECLSTQFISVGVDERRFPLAFDW